MSTDNAVSKAIDDYVKATEQIATLKKYVATKESDIRAVIRLGLASDEDKVRAEAALPKPRKPRANKADKTEA